jgi:hypothetical protein
MLKAVLVVLAVVVDFFHQAALVVMLYQAKEMLAVLVL